MAETDAIEVPFTCGGTLVPDPADPDKQILLGKCECYKDRHLDPELQAKAAAVGHAVSAGLCWRYPTPIARQDTDSCGEHSELHKRRFQYLARWIGDAVADALAERKP